MAIQSVAWQALSLRASVLLHRKPPGMPGLMKKTVLIVEDDHDIATTLRDRLEMLGFDIVTAYDGLSALEALERARPDLMLLDLHLPRLSGFEVLEQVAARRAEGSPSHDVPIVIMSAFLQAERAAMALDAGVHSFVGKPFEWNEFFGILEHAVREHARKRAGSASSDGDQP